MRTLTATLLAAQQRATAVPQLKIEAVSKIAGVNKYSWTRLYDGAEDDYFHALTMPGDGSLVRARITPPGDSRKLYRQRVSSPGAGSDFSQWTYTNQYNAVVTAAASLNTEASIFWIKTNREIRRFKSIDYGANWGSAELIDYAPTTAIYGIAAAYKSNGDIAVFIADTATLYVMKCIGGQWQAQVAWDKTTGNLSGVACVYDGDWNLLVTGKDTAGNFKLWSLVYGDGGDVGAGTWSALREIATAPAGGDYEYKQPFLDKTDVYRSFFTEKYGGIEAYSRPFGANTLPGMLYSDGRWREPVPFNVSCEYGLAMAHYGDYGWLASPDGVWRASLAPQSLDLTGDVISARQEISETAGSLTIKLDNSDGKYASPGQGDIVALDKGCQLEFSPGYRTIAGSEYSAGQTYCVESIEHVSTEGKASVILRARDRWGALSDWSARYQFRWNKTASDKSVKDIIAVILARTGLKLEVKSQSATITGFYPDFTVNPNDNGKSVIGKLLSFAPDVIFIEGNKAFLVNPQSADSAEYSYGTDHVILEGSYRQGAINVNAAEVEGYDTSQGKRIVVNSFNWSEVARLNDRIKHVEDRNLNTTAKAYQRGEALLRKAEIESVSGTISVPVNCGQQLYDVIAVTDARACLAAAKRRVTGMTLVYQPQRGEYYQRIELGGV
ncbi:MAG: hypothetical protein A2Z15_05365 [Chloroflexi bacterium RBG_16_50_11]|nr:MAG: hypothetical protein A2Z15_05365 [Chloroflexi bacterium RBG_16_50_11]